MTLNTAQSILQHSPEQREEVDLGWVTLLGNALLQKVLML